jgi:hypothetical protein
MSSAFISPLISESAWRSWRFRHRRSSSPLSGDGATDDGNDPDDDASTKRGLGMLSSCGFAIAFGDGSVVSPGSFVAAPASFPSAPARAETFDMSTLLPVVSTRAGT